MLLRPLGATTPFRTTTSCRTSCERRSRPLLPALRLKEMEHGRCADKALRAMGGSMLTYLLGDVLRIFSGDFKAGEIGGMVAPRSCGWESQI